MHALYAKVLGPVLFPALVYLLSIPLGKYVRHEYGHDGNQLVKLIRSVAAFFAAKDILAAWHLEIANAWTSYPSATAGVLLLAIPLIVFLFMPALTRNTLLRADGDSPRAISMFSDAN